MRKGICMSKKKEREPQWYMSEVGVPVYNYHVYYMKKVEKTIDISTKNDYNCQAVQ